MTIKNNSELKIVFKSIKTDDAEFRIQKAFEILLNRKSDINKFHDTLYNKKVPKIPSLSSVKNLS